MQSWSFVSAIRGGVDGDDHTPSQRQVVTATLTVCCYVEVSAAKAAPTPGGDEPARDGGPDGQYSRG